MNAIHDKLWLKYIFVLVLSLYGLVSLITHRATEIDTQTNAYSPLNKHIHRMVYADVFVCFTMYTSAFISICLSVCVCTSLPSFYNSLSSSIERNDIVVYGDVLFTQILDFSYVFRKHKLKKTHKKKHTQKIYEKKSTQW